MTDREGDLWDDLIAERMISAEHAAAARTLDRAADDVRAGLVRLRGRIAAADINGVDAIALTNAVDALIDTIDAARLTQ